MFVTEYGSAQCQLSSCPALQSKTGSIKGYGKVKVNCNLVQALRLCTGRTAHRGSRGIALLFLDHGTRRGKRSASSSGRFYPRERPGTHCTGGWVGPRAGLDRCGKSRSHRDLILGPSNPSQSLYWLSYPAQLYLSKKGKVHPCIGTEALYRPYGPLRE